MWNWWVIVVLKYNWVVDEMLLMKLCLVNKWCLMNYYVWYEMFDKEMLRCFCDVGLWPTMMLYWDVVNCGVGIKFMIVSHTLHFEMELMLVKMACIGKYWDEGLCLVDASINWQIFEMGVLLQKGTTCICIVLSHIIWLHKEVCFDVVNVYYYCWLWDEKWWCYMI